MGTKGSERSPAYLYRIRKVDEYKGQDGEMVAVYAENREE
jgi:hypothetical protein